MTDSQKWLIRRKMESNTPSVDNFGGSHYWVYFEMTSGQFLEQPSYFPQYMTKDMALKALAEARKNAQQAGLKETVEAVSLEPILVT